MSERPLCDCYDDFELRRGELSLHADEADESSDAWRRLLDLIDEAADEEWEEFEPRRTFAKEIWWSLTTLPATISRLKSVKRLNLYGSGITRIPPEIGEMSSLEEFTPYTSYGLHWFPYEIKRCSRLANSTVSTRALYGNFKSRPPFPDLKSDANRRALELARPARCSVCAGPFGEAPLSPRWISLGVATDVLPLLVFPCSSECVARLPTPPGAYAPTSHFGGLSLPQPPRR